MTMRCTIVIPVYNHAALTHQCLHRLLACPAQTVEQVVVVVDDGSRDGTAELLAAYADRVQVVTHAVNQGFAHACNDGAQASSGELVVFLNNDTLPVPGWLDELVSYTERHPEASIVGGRLLYADGSVQHAGVVIGQDGFPWNLYAGFPGDHPAVTRSRQVPAVTGACLLARRPVFDQLGGFDTAFVNGYEDVDFCLRVAQQGGQVHYCHTSVVYHLEGSTRGSTHPHHEQNIALYRQRWGHIPPNDVPYYLADGLLRLDYPYPYPLNLWVDPRLAVVNREERDRELEQLLNRRAREAFELQRENMRLVGKLSQRPPAPPLQPPAPVEPRLTLPAPPTRRRFEPGERRPVEIIIPNFNGPHYLQATVESVIAHTDLAFHTLTVVDDASTDPAVRDYLDDLRRRAARAAGEGTPLYIRILLNARNRGFVATANCGLRLSQDDVILLNSDTLVTANWVEKLQQAAYSRPGIASVTPFSNNATIFSIPEFNQPNDLPPGYTVDSFAALVERVALREYPQVPTGHGFCMYMTRAALDTVGLLDEDRFAPIYAEENDWSMRAAKQGYRHILDDATFIYHQGTVTSTSSARDRLLQAHLSLLDQLHPEYMPLVAEFCAENPLRHLQERIRRTL